MEFTIIVPIKGSKFLSFNRYEDKYSKIYDWFLNLIPRVWGIAIQLIVWNKR